jgi:hypothetical protein
VRRAARELRDVRVAEPALRPRRVAPEQGGRFGSSAQRSTTSRPKLNEAGTCQRNESTARR